MNTSVDALNAELAQQTELFNKLRIENSDPAALEESRKRLGEIKRELASIKPEGKDSKKKGRLLLKTPKVRHLFLSFPATEMYLRFPHA
jgi:histidyl-tRNA synthetase